MKLQERKWAKGRKMENVQEGKIKKWKGGYREKQRRLEGRRVGEFGDTIQREQAQPSKL
jgi:hypothetical protein